RVHSRQSREWRKMTGLRLLLSVAFLCGASLAQNAPLPLAIKTRLPVQSEKAQGFVLPIKSDADGNIYLRVNEREVVRGGPVLKIAADGSKVIRYDLAKSRELSSAQIVDFAPTSGGGLILAVRRTRDQFYLVRFDADGTIRSEVRLEGDIAPLQLAEFGTGELLIAGTKAGGDSAEIDSIPTVALYTHRGQLIRTLLLKEDLAPAEKSGRATPSGSIRQDRTFEDALVLSSLHSSDDGNIYLMRPGNSGPIFVVSPGGRIVRRITLEPPRRASYLGAMAVSRRRIAAKYVINRDEGGPQIASIVLRVFDSDSGKLLGEYEHSDPSIGSAFAAYDGAE